MQTLTPSIRAASRRKLGSHPTSRPAAFLNELDALLAASGIIRRATPPICSAADSNGSAGERVLSPRIGRVVSYIDEHLDAPLTVDRLASEAELSKYHFSRIFRREIGKSPWSFVREARVQKAKELLEHGSPAAAAAVEAGFFDQSHLTKTMRDVDGTTPSEYQKARRESTDLQD